MIATIALVNRGKRNTYDRARTVLKPRTLGMVDRVVIDRAELWFRSDNSLSFNQCYTELAKLTQEPKRRPLPPFVSRIEGEYRSGKHAVDPRSASDGPSPGVVNYLHVTDRKSASVLHAATITPTTRWIC